MQFLSLILVFMVIFLVLWGLWQLLPFLLIFWAAMWVVNYFRTRKLRKQIEANYNSFFDDAFSFHNQQRQQSASQPRAQVPVREPKEDSIDVEYIEYDDPDSQS